MEDYSLTEQEKKECIEKGLKKEDFFEDYDPFTASLMYFLFKKFEKNPEEDIKFTEIVDFRTTYFTLTDSFPPFKNYYYTGKKVINKNYECRIMTDEEMEAIRMPLSNLTEENIKEAINESYVYFKSQPTNKPRLSPYCSALMYMDKYAGPGLHEDEKVRFNAIFKDVMLEKGIPEVDIRFDHLIN